VASSRSFAVLWSLLTVLGSPVAAQDSGRLRVTTAEENFRAAPNGGALAVLVRGGEFASGEERGRWRALTLEGWVASSALERRGAGEHPLAVRRSGTPLHASPGGPVVARASGGLLVREVERRGDWVRIARRGWVWGESVAAAPPPADTPRAAAPPSIPAVPAGAAAPHAAPSAAGRVVIHAAPGGDTLAVLDGGDRLRVLGRNGDWVRVQLEGWTRDSAVVAAASRAAAGGPSPRQLRESPEVHHGATVRWQAQFVAVQRADSLRRDLAPGETFVLAREPQGETGFVYIVVPAELLAEVRRLVPLQRIEFTARVRSARSAQMGHPILEMIELRPLS
jgi:pyruvate/2-oxoglutarate dehydrogenase complex dihydrolipoamide acyltransferase (E2) component